MESKRRKLEMRKLIFFMVIIAGLILSACSVPLTLPASETQKPGSGEPVGSTQQLTTVDALVSQLNQTGSPVTKVESILQDFLQAPGEILRLANQDVQVYQYPDSVSRQQDSAKISADGTTIGNSQITWVDQPHFWAKDNLIVLYVGSDQGVIDQFNSVIGNQINEPISRDGSISSNQPYPPAVFAAITTLSQDLMVDINQIQVIEYEHVDWPDSCLGVNTSEVACMMIVTPGYRVVLAYNGAEYELHTDETGRRVEYASGYPPVSPGYPPSSPGESPNQPQPLPNVIGYLSHLKGISTGDISVVSVEAVQWPDSCLGLAQRGEVCAEVIVPGYQIILQVGNNTYEIHTDQTGENIRIK
jgi:hypothetical protein